MMLLKIKAHEELQSLFMLEAQRMITGCAADCLIHLPTHVNTTVDQKTPISSEEKNIVYNG
jgi:hypothetical protein